MKVKTDYPRCPYITDGKTYEVVDVDPRDQNIVTIYDDDGDKTTIVIEELSCPHLDYIGSWDVVKDSNNES